MKYIGMPGFIFVQGRIYEATRRGFVEPDVDSTVDDVEVKQIYKSMDIVVISCFGEIGG